jgi:YfiH family protein
LFRLDPDQVYRSTRLEQLSWLDHGFGTRSADQWPPLSSRATLRQIHSNRVIAAEAPGDAGEGDALISNVPGVTLVVRTADCLPILMADARNHAVAAVHAGWRGTVSEILAETLTVMKDRFGTRPEELVVAIGPGIGGCCYEVSADVAVRFARYFPEREDLSGTTKIDLAETAVRQLARYGGNLGQIDPSGLCTFCLQGVFHSYRRDRDAAGRMHSSITIR